MEENQKGIAVSFIRLLCGGLAVLICCQLSYGRLPPSAAKDFISQQESDEQLEINKNALLEGQDESIRVGAAFLIISDSSPNARQILLDILKSDKNKPARILVCKALSRYRTEKKEIPAKQDFIEPLFSIITSSEDTAEAKQASEALLIFKYEEIAGQIEKLAKDSSTPVKTRLNAIYALQLQPDMRATVQLMRLVDDPDKQVSAEAEKALRAIGVPYGQDSATRTDIIKELEGKGKDKFLQDWLIRQEFNRKTLEDNVKLWRGRFFSTLDKLYSQITDDVERGKFLSGFLPDSEPQVRLWTLDKVYKWWVGTGPKSGILTDIKPALSILISDSDRDVRLKTAQLLSLMGEGDWIAPLTEQYKKEQDAEIKTALFDALGWAVYYGSLPNAAVKVSPELKRQVLKWAEEYLADNDTKKSQKGVDVIRKLLEQEGLSPAEAEHYLSVLQDRYNQKPADEVLSSQLLDAMAKLCAGSVYKDKAAVVFRPLFEQAIKNQADGIRQAAVEGLINIDKSSALKMLRTDFINDKNPVIRQDVIELADGIGTKDDLSWLEEKIGSNSESKPAWQAMLKIFKRGDSAVIYEWIDRLEAKSADGKLTNEQMILFLETAEAKITAEKTPSKSGIRNIQTRLAKFYRANGDYEKAAKYIGFLLTGDTTASQKESRLAELLEVYLRWPNLSLAAQLLSNRLLQEDLDENNPLVISIDNYLTGLPAGADPNTVLGPLHKIQAPGKPKWNAQLQKWSQQFAAPSDPNQPK